MVEATTTSGNSSFLSTSSINSLVTVAMSGRSKQVAALNTRKGDLDLLKGILTDVNTKLGGLNTVAQQLAGQDDNYKLGSARTVIASDTAVINAAAGAGAATGSYDFAVTALAKAQSIRGKHFDDVEAALNLSGTFDLNGTSINIDETDTLTTIRDAINGAVYAEGKQVNAAIVDNHLVLSAAHTGLDYTLSGEDTSGTVLQDLDLFVGGVVQNQLQAAANAEFTVNTMSVSRSSNSSLSDVISGVTLNLTKVGESRLSISTDMNSATGKVNDFIAKFNDALGYIKTKTSTTKVASGNDSSANPTYQRAALAGDASMLTLRGDLYRAAMTRSSNGGLADIGIEFDSTTMELKISDSAKLSAALSGDFAQTSALLKDVATAVTDKLSPFVQSETGIMARRLADNEQRLTTFAAKIERADKDFKAESERVRSKYMGLQAQLLNLYNQQNEWLSIMSLNVTDTSA